MTFLVSFALVVASVTTILTSTPAHASPVRSTTIETKTAIVTTDATEGNYFEFLDKSGGWWLEADGEHPTFEVGQVMKFTIDNRGMADLEDDKLLILESMGFVN